MCVKETKMKRRKENGEFVDTRPISARLDLYLTLLPTTLPVQSLLDSIACVGDW